VTLTPTRAAPRNGLFHHRNAPQPPPTADENADARRLADMTTALLVETRQHRKLLTEIVPPKVLSARLVQIPAAGVWTHALPVLVRAAAVTNLGSSPLTVLSGTANGAAPTQGAGIKQVPPYGHATVPVSDTAITIWGVPGSSCNVDLLSKTPAPTGDAHPYPQSAIVTAGVLTSLIPAGAALLGYRLVPTDALADTVTFTDTVTTAIRWKDATAAGGSLTYAFPAPLAFPGGITVACSDATTAGAVLWTL
jgi:hypothetical protein